MTGAVTRVVLLIAAIILGGVVVFYGILSDAPLPDRRWLHGKNDLALHALAFFALSLPVLALWPRLMTVIALTGLATGVEVAQFWLPRRNPGVDDILASLAGVLLGAAVLLCLRKALSMRRSVGTENTSLLNSEPDAHPSDR